MKVECVAPEPERLVAVGQKVDSISLQLTLDPCAA